MPEEVEKIFPHRKLDKGGLEARAEILKRLALSVSKKVERINGQIMGLTTARKELQYEWVDAVWRLGVIPENISKFQVLAFTEDEVKMLWSLEEPEFKEMGDAGK